ncbi:4824_t:CDS:1, partial [Gigaspora rosea]
MSLSLDDSTVPQNGLLSIEDTHEQQPTAQDSEPLLFSLNEGINI